MPKAGISCPVWNSMPSLATAVKARRVRGRLSSAHTPSVLQTSTFLSVSIYAALTLVISPDSAFAASVPSFNRCTRFALSTAENGILHL